MWVYKYVFTVSKGNRLSRWTDKGFKVIIAKYIVLQCTHIF